MVTKTNDQELNSLLLGNENIIIKFYADWCGSCRLFAPKFTKLSNKAEYDSVKFLEINAEESPEARKLAGVNNLPYFATFKNGKLLHGDTTAKEESVEKMILDLKN
jgi:thiol-disulfide isomerase/thioredoxin